MQRNADNNICITTTPAPYIYLYCYLRLLAPPERPIRYEQPRVGRMRSPCACAHAPKHHSKHQTAMNRTWALQISIIKLQITKLWALPSRHDQSFKSQTACTHIWALPSHKPYKCMQANICAQHTCTRRTLCMYAL